MNASYKFSPCKKALLCLFGLLMNSVLFAQIDYYEPCRVATGLFIPGGNAPGYTAALGLDGAGLGWLRLTNCTGNQVGFVKFAPTFPSSQGVIIEFDFKVWGPVDGQLADGFSVFLFNGANHSTFTIGANGGALGYSTNSGQPGMPNAYVGIGIDEFGNFANHGPDASPAPSTRPNFIGIRNGTFNWVDGTPSNLGTNTYIGYSSAPTTAINTSTRPADNAYYRRVKVDILPNGGGMKVNVYLRTSPTGAWQSMLTNVQITTPVPTTFGMGFAATTGGSMAYHEVRDVIVRTPGNLSVDIPEIPCIDPFDTVTVPVHIVNGWGNVNNVTMCDTLPADFNLISQPTATGSAGAVLSYFSQTTLPDGRLLCCYRLNISSYENVTITYKGLFNSGIQPRSITVGSTLTPPSGGVGELYDVNPNDNYATRTVPLIRYDTVSATICMGESYNFNGSPYTTAGFHTKTLQGLNGCDSLITLNLIVNPCPVYNTISRVICEGTSYDFNGKILTAAGTYIDTLLNMYGGDSVLTLHLAINPTYHIHLNGIVCVGKPYVKYGFTIPVHDNPGSYDYERQLQTTNGCDSIVTLTLSVPEVVVEISSSNPDFCDTYETILSAITPNSKVDWNTGATTPDITVNHPGIYTVVASEHDCTAMTAYIIEECPIVIVFPNAITPGNQDGINDWFYLAAAGAVYEFSIVIYDRWGECIFTSIDPHFRWGGTVKGKIIQGVYTYAVNYRASNDQKSKSFVGVVTVY